MFYKKLENKDGIYLSGIERKSTNKIVEFYEKQPFPGYKLSDNKFSILETGNKNLFLNQFKKLIGQNKDVLEVGCGTGQISNFLAVGTNNRIASLDPTLRSLKIAYSFSKKNNIKNITYVNADINDKILKKDFFDFIWCNGVLHHTESPYESFQTVVSTLKPGGYIVLGLYNFLGRIRMKFRKYLYKIFGKRIIMILDPILRSLKSDNQINAWIKDQYESPLESVHSFDEILQWFNSNNIEFVNSIPNSDFDYSEQKKYFVKKKYGNYLSSLFNQFLMIFNKLGDDGGLFIFIGKKSS